MSNPELCAGTNAGGAPCGKKPMLGEAFCWFHNPKTEAARSAGARPPREPLLTEPAGLETVEEVHDLLRKVVNDLATSADPDSRRARSLVVCANALTRLVIIRDLRRQAEEAEQELEETRCQLQEAQRMLGNARADAESYRRSLTELRDELYALRLASHRPPAYNTGGT